MMFEFSKRKHGFMPKEPTGLFKRKQFSGGSPILKGMAAISGKQDMFQALSRRTRGEVMRSRYPMLDSDRDGVPNWKDCQPLNRMKQETKVFQNPFKSMDMFVRMRMNPIADEHYRKRNGNKSATLKPGSRIPSAIGEREGKLFFYYPQDIGTKHVEKKDGKKSTWTSYHEPNLLALSQEHKAPIKYVLKQGSSKNPDSRYEKPKPVDLQYGWMSTRGYQVDPRADETGKGVPNVLAKNIQDPTDKRMLTFHVQKGNKKINKREQLVWSLPSGYGGYGITSKMREETPEQWEQLKKMKGTQCPFGEDPTSLVCKGMTEGSEGCNRYCYDKKTKIYGGRVGTGARNLYLSQGDNYLKTVGKAEKKTFEDAMVEKILAGKQNYYRVHEAGDFYDTEYVNKWKRIAQRVQEVRPEFKFYAFTKAAGKQVEGGKINLADMPENFNFMVSRDKTNLNADDANKTAKELLNEYENKHLPSGRTGLAYVGATCPPGFTECPCNDDSRFGVNGADVGCGFPYKDSTTGKKHTACHMCSEGRKIFLKEHA
jgi:hypothetical protein